MKKIVMVCLLMTVIHAAESELDRGVSALKHKQYDVALSKFLTLANQGNQIAQQNLGVMYNAGLGVKKDCTRAAYWFNMAASFEYPYELVAFNN
jgi:TPR repeat protein